MKYIVKYHNPKTGESGEMIINARTCKQAFDFVRNNYPGFYVYKEVRKCSIQHGQR